MGSAATQGERLLLFGHWWPGAGLGAERGQPLWGFGSAQASSALASPLTGLLVIVGAWKWFIMPKRVCKLCR